MAMIDQQTAARRLIHSAIRNIANFEDPVANHVSVMAAFDLMREYAEAKGSDYFDVADLYKAEHRREVIKDYVKKAWYYLKHARDDADRELDTHRLPGINISFTIINCLTYKQIFGVSSHHMTHLLNYIASENPEFLKEEARNEVLARSGEFMKLPEKKRQEYFRNALSLFPELAQEVQSDTALAHEPIDY